MRSRRGPRGDGESIRDRLSRLRWWRRIDGLAWGRRLGWAIVVGSLAVWWTSQAGIVMSPSLVAAQAGLPYLLAPLVITVAWAGWRRDGAIVGMGAIVSVFLIWSTVPIVRAAAPPQWARSSPSFTLASANVFRGNSTPDAALAALGTLDADVVVINELTAELEASLDASTLGRSHPFRHRSGGDIVVSRLPWRATGHLASCELGSPSATIQVGGRDVEVVAVHTSSPSNWLRREAWSREFLALERAAAERRGTTFVFAGDFNATRFHAPFRTLLNMGLRDAHDTLGHGWRPSWGPRQLPVLGDVGVFRLDHALSFGDVTPTQVRDLDIPGSDHRGMLVTYAVRPAADGIQFGRADS